MKMNELKVLVAEMKPDIVIITETWTHPDIHNDYLVIDGYEITARSDRKDTAAGRGGGILVQGVWGWRLQIRYTMPKNFCSFYVYN